ncbi:MAG: WYL domain-containing protein, partial [Bacteroidales bacterium]|nr:WYL domain-containing protein [Bacteroidales bacterium]
MPANKNAMTRYMLLDELLSDQYHDYSLDDLTEEVNYRLAELYPDTDGVGRRTIEKDIFYLEQEGPFMVEIEREWKLAINSDTGKTTKKKCLRYKDPSFCIFKKEMSNDEKHLLKEALSLLGQFEGLPNLEALESLRIGLNHDIADDRTVISFTKNPLENTSLFAKLFTAIAHKQVVEIEYHTFFAPEQKKQIIVHPYLLKEYNRRWFLIAGADSDMKILTFGLERIDKVTPSPLHKYTEASSDISERFEDIIGITFDEKMPTLRIIFWVSDSERHYLETKPMHESQAPIRGESEKQLRDVYKNLSEGRFFRIDCKYNYELIRELTSYGKD